MKYDVAVMGLYVLDILGLPVTHIPSGGALEFIDAIRLTVAGTAGGTAVDCAKLGMTTRAVGAVGHDEKGDFVLRTLQRHAIDTSLMQIIDEIPTSSTILCIRPNGERPALHNRGASDYFTVLESVYPDLFNATYLHMGGTGLLRAMDGEPTKTVLKEAKKAGCVVTFDLIGASASTAGLVEPLLPYIDYFIPSIEEARSMSGITALEDMAHFYLERGVGTCIFTMGDHGSFIATADEHFLIPAYDVPVVDTTGCGDAYSAAFIAALHHDFDLETSARFATAASALVATGLGSDAGIISFEDCLEKMTSLPIKRG